MIRYSALGNVTICSFCDIEEDEASDGVDGPTDDDYAALQQMKSQMKDDGYSNDSGDDTFWERVGYPLRKPGSDNDDDIDDSEDDDYDYLDDIDIERYPDKKHKEYPWRRDQLDYRAKLASKKKSQEEAVMEASKESEEETEEEPEEEAQIDKEEDEEETEGEHLLAGASIDPDTGRILLPAEETIEGCMERAISEQSRRLRPQPPLLPPPPHMLQSGSRWARSRWARSRSRSIGKAAKGEGFRQDGPSQYRAWLSWYRAAYESRDNSRQ